MERNNILKIENLHVSYGPVRALRGIGLEVYEGEIVVLIGANGAGKTSLVESILGITPAEKGHITFMGEDITKKKTEHIVASGICLLNVLHMKINCWKCRAMYSASITL